MTDPSVRTRSYTIVVLGRTLEHLGYQMYKRRDAAIAELVANCWDAGATRVTVQLPADPYDPATSSISVEDDGAGMDEEEVQTDYLVVGRNRRHDKPFQGARAVMGRKGIGKLAGFGIANEMEVVTWRAGTATRIVLDADALKAAPDDVRRVPIEGLIGPAPEGVGDNGTRVTLRRLKHATPMASADLAQSLGRRFSRTVYGQMEITVDGVAVREPELDLLTREPAEGDAEATLDGGTVVRYHVGFTRKPISLTELRGFAIHVRGKTAQAPPYFFGVEGTASGQHGTRYLTGAISADFVDEGTDEETDIISTDRQEIEWDAPLAGALKKWGEELTRRALRDWANRRGDELQRRVTADLGLTARLDALDAPSKKQATDIIRKLAEADSEPERAMELAGAIVRAFEYRHFTDVIGHIEAVSRDDPEQLRVLLEHLADWKVLESRAILEIVKGRLQIVEKFHAMIVADAPETAPAVGVENMHDLIAAYPWLVDPDWQVLAEEKGITTTLREWGSSDIDPADRDRYDFLALADERRLVIVEIKRSGHAVTFDDLQRLLSYKERLRKAHPETEMVMISGGHYTADLADFASVVMLSWGEVYERTRRYYQHYLAVLQGDVESTDFHKKEREIAQTRRVLEAGAYRSPEERAAGLGPQDFAEERSLRSVRPAGADDGRQAAIARPAPDAGEE